MRVNKTSLLELTATDRREGVVICVGRRLLYADKPKYRKACAFKNNVSYNSDNTVVFLAESHFMTNGL